MQRNPAGHCKRYALLLDPWEKPRQSRLQHLRSLDPSQGHSCHVERMVSGQVMSAKRRVCLSPVRIVRSHAGKVTPK